jgi:hypothetical protein
MSVLAGPVLIALAALVGLVFIAWLLSSWFQDQYALPIEEADRMALPDREREA